MDLTKINLNYYSFGYLGGFVDKSIKKMTIKELSELADSLHLGGIEFPVDYLFCDKYLDLDNYLKNNKGLNIFISFENFNVKVLKLIIPILKSDTKIDGINSIDFCVGIFRPVFSTPKKGNWHPTYSIDFIFKI